MKIHFHITKNQLRKLKNLKSFNMSQTQVHNPDKKQTEHLTADANDLLVKKIKKAHKSGSGLRIDPHLISNAKQMIIGNGLWDDISGGINRGIDFVKEHAPDVIETAKSVIPRDVAKTTLQGLGTGALTGLAALTAQPELLAAAPVSKWSY
jgi:hypothetical protein